MNVTTNTHTHKLTLTHRLNKDQKNINKTTRNIHSLTHTHTHTHAYSFDISKFSQMMENYIKGKDEMLRNISIILKDGDGNEKLEIS